MVKTDSVVVGVDVGATKVLIGYVSQDGTVFRSQRYPMERSDQAHSLSSVRDALDDFLATEWSGPAPLALGLGLVGWTDPANGIWMHALNLAVHTPVRLASEFQARYGMPVALDNDVHAATLAELRLGMGRESQDFIYLNVGTGIASGLVCNGRLVRGAANYTGELGHMVVESQGDVCQQCGRRGCLEPIASGGGMLEHVRTRLPAHPGSHLQEAARSGQLTVGTLIQAAKEGDPLAVAVTERALRALGLALVNLVNLLNPGVIVLGGGVFSEGWGVERLRAHVAENGLPAAVSSLQGIVLSELQVDRVGLLGAACLAWEQQMGRTPDAP